MYYNNTIPFLHLTVPVEVMLSLQFEKWWQKLKDNRAHNKIKFVLRSFEQAELGEIKFLSHGIYERKINFGPGYRLYFAPIGKQLILLLNGGDKSTQVNDIRKAIKIRNTFDDKKYFQKI